MDLELRDQVALVTGGSRGLGEAICRGLAAEGVRVVVDYRTGEEAAVRVAADLESDHGVEAVAIGGDVSREEDVESIFDRIEARFPGVDILVNNAGVCPPCLVKEMSTDLWNSTIEVNLTGTFLASREMVRRRLNVNRPGRIINIVTPAAFLGWTSGKSHYAASKGGVVAFTVSLAREVASHGILVNAVAPGMMYTDMTSDTLDANKERYSEVIPLGRIAGTDEVADVITFLVSGKNRYMTGATVDVSGGLLMR